MEQNAFPDPESVRLPARIHAEPADGAAADAGEREDAFLLSDAHQLFGAPLRPFSYARAAAAEKMGFNMFRIRPEDIDPVSGAYPGHMHDVVILLWLCSVEDDLVRRALRAPEAASAEALAWADASGIAWPRQRYFAAARVFAEITNEIVKARDYDVVPDAPGGGLEKKA